MFSEQTCHCHPQNTATAAWIICAKDTGVTWGVDQFPPRRSLRSPAGSLSFEPYHREVTGLLEPATAWELHRWASAPGSAWHSLAIYWARGHWAPLVCSAVLTAGMGREAGAAPASEKMAVLPPTHVPPRSQTPAHSRGGSGLRSDRQCARLLWSSSSLHVDLGSFGPFGAGGRTPGSQQQCPLLRCGACWAPSKAPDSSAHSQVISCLCAQALAHLSDQTLPSAVPSSLCWCPRKLSPSPSCGSPTADTENHSSLPSVINRYR